MTHKEQYGAIVCGMLDVLRDCEIYRLPRPKLELDRESYRRLETLYKDYMRNTVRDPNPRGFPYPPMFMGIEIVVKDR